ncbi:M20/M25/M40 family metallo-hydrolase [bacterium]|nr:M20/M25/M40 family metallo-hydrolase [bacterium]
MINLEILKFLLSARSTSPDDGGILPYVAKILEEHGFVTYIKKFGPEDDTTLNLYAEFGSAGNNICFAGHVDVVPSGPLSDWHYDPFDMKVVGDHIYGRGAVDMKGAVFCMIHALIDWANSKQSGRVSLLLTSDEEAKATSPGRLAASLCLALIARGQSGDICRLDGLSGRVVSRSQSASIGERRGSIPASWRRRSVPTKPSGEWIGRRKLRRPVSAP